VLLRLEVLVQQASSNLPVSSIRQQIVAAVDLIVQLKRLRDSRRCVSQVTEVVNVDASTGSIRLRDIFVMGDDDDASTELTPTGQLPTFMEQLISRGMIDLDSFYV